MDGGGGHRIEKGDGGVSVLKVTVGGREVREPEVESGVQFLSCAR